MTIKTLAAKGVPKRAIARQLSLSEGTVRYHLRRLACGAVDGRARQVRRAFAVRKAIAHWFSQYGGLPVNLAALHSWLANEHGYAGSLRSIQRYVSEAYPTVTATRPTTRGDPAWRPGPSRLGKVSRAHHRRRVAYVTCLAHGALAFPP